MSFHFYNYIPIYICMVKYRYEVNTMFEFRKHIKKLKDYKTKYKKFSKEDYLDNEGYVTFNVDAKKDELISNYKVNDKELISTDFISNLEKYSEPVPYSYPIRIKINSIDDITNLDNMYKEHYKLKIILTRNKLKINLLKALGLLFLGILLFILYFILKENTNWLYLEIISIAATFSIWEAVDVFLLERQEIKIELANNIQLGLAKVVINEKNN